MVLVPGLWHSEINEMVKKSFFKNFKNYGYEPKSSGLYYKTITIIITTILSDATIWSLSYGRNWRHKLRLKAKARIINYYHL
jgi:hypothetical protein